MVEIKGSKWMDKKQVFEALDGLFAYDSGCTDSGIHDEKLRSEVISHLNNLSETDLRILLSEFTREQFLTDDALRRGYGIEDVGGFLEWLAKYMYMDFR